MADIVYVNPVNTDYSRVLKNKECKLSLKDQSNEGLHQFIKEALSKNNKTAKHSSNK